MTSKPRLFLMGPPLKLHPPAFHCHPQGLADSLLRLHLHKNLLTKFAKKAF